MQLPNKYAHHTLNSKITVTHASARKMVCPLAAPTWTVTKTSGTRMEPRKVIKNSDLFYYKLLNIFDFH